MDGYCYACFLSIFCILSNRSDGFQRFQGTIGTTNHAADLIFILALLPPARRCGCGCDCRCAGRIDQECALCSGNVTVYLSVGLPTPPSSHLSPAVPPSGQQQQKDQLQAISACMTASERADSISAQRQEHLTRLVGGIFGGVALTCLICCLLAQLRQWIRLCRQRRIRQLQTHAAVTTSAGGDDEAQAGRGQTASQRASFARGDRRSETADLARLENGRIGLSGPEASSADAVSG
ncbi:unnamed protein product [Protopolystoma xenopodis]|uniref:Uncharacterized protein n=1 Tax=Protopolystoma xenopodis TaxID=117903 RepID=A0A3S4ZHS3_9PLAT|nr:unnamed protein product [Protopolystoma xenopodis]